MGYLKRKTDTRVVEFEDAGGNVQSTGSLTELLNAIQRAKRHKDDLAYRRRKNKKRNQQREGR